MLSISYKAECRLADPQMIYRGINVVSRGDFEQMNKAITANGLRFLDVIDRTFKFEQAMEAFEYLWAGKHVGKVVIKMT